MKYQKSSNNHNNNEKTKLSLHFNVVSVIMMNFRQFLGSYPPTKVRQRQKTANIAENKGYFLHTVTSHRVRVLTRNVKPKSQNMAESTNKRTKTHSELKKNILTLFVSLRIIVVSSLHRTEIYFTQAYFHELQRESSIGIQRL